MRAALMLWDFFLAPCVPTTTRYTRLDTATAVMPTDPDAAETLLTIAELLALAQD
jgi:hypothetical protein